MIDLHSHILHGLDDGPETLDQSLEMCRRAYSDGIRTIFATPHVMNGVYESDRPVILARIEELKGALCRCEFRNSTRGQPFGEGGSFVQPDLRVLPGADVHLDEAILRHLRQGRLMTLGDKGRYLLLEFPYHGIPYLTEKILFELLANGITPIITHPERNPEVERNLPRYYQMIEMGCLAQVTAMSLTGGFGPEVKRLGEKLLVHGLVHIIASDAHSIERRPPVLTSAIRAASKLVGDDEAKRMVSDYPQSILEGKRPNVPKPVPINT